MPAHADLGQPDEPEPLISRTVSRSLAGRRASYADEVQRIVDATYQVIERTGSLDPTMRDILRQSGLSTQAFYRHFRSKDELLVALLDDGRRRLVGYLEHRMAKAASPAGQVRAWIEGVLAQSADHQAAARTRPFLANQDRLADQYPSEQQESADLLIHLLADPLTALAPSASPERLRMDAVSIYHLVFGTLHQHLRHGTAPDPAEVDQLVAFVESAVTRDG
jgi:AcrR family transcriptional regulator